jgi:hypothetical protein
LVSLYDDFVALAIALPLRSHWYVNVWPGAVHEPFERTDSRVVDEGDL